MVGARVRCGDRGWLVYGDLSTRIPGTGGLNMQLDAVFPRGYPICILSGHPPPTTLTKRRSYPLFLQAPLPILQLRIHAHNTPHKVPIPTSPNPITNHNSRTPITHILPPLAPIKPPNTFRLVMSPTQKVHHRGVQLGGNLLGPAPDFPEITRAQKIDVERLFWRRVRALGGYTWQGADALRSSLEVSLGEL